jgi:hypothetical protein
MTAFLERASETGHSVEDKEAYAAGTAAQASCIP